MQAGLDQLAGDPAAAEAGYRAVVAAAQAAAGIPGALRLPARPGRTDAEAALDAGLAAAQSAALRFAKAGILETRGDIEGAIAAYETLYAADTGSPVLANNLASLISSYRDDPESLARAFAVARRLRGSEVPQFQDTYGWILHRRGDNDQALGYLARPPRRCPRTRSCSSTSPRPRLALGRRAEARWLRPRGCRRRGRQCRCPSSRSPAPASPRSTRSPGASRLVRARTKSCH